MSEERVERSTDLPLEPDEAWRVVTEPDELERWLAPEVELDLREGGEVVVRERDGDERHGTVVEVEPPTRWVFTWEDGDRPSTVEITLEPTDPGTRVRVIEWAVEQELALAA